MLAGLGKSLTTVFVFVAFTFALAVFGKGIPGQSAHAKPPALVENGQSEYRIVLPDEPTDTARHAAQELARYVEQISGAELPVVDSDGGDGPVVRFEIGPGTALGLGGFRLSTGEQGITFQADDANGLLYATYHFLDQHLGVRWYSPDFTRVPEQSDIAPPAMDEKRSPRFGYREVFAAVGDDPDYSARNRLNGRLGHRLANAADDPPAAFRNIRQLNIFQLVPKGEYESEHPEYYGNGQLQFARAEVQQIAIDAVLERLAAWSEEETDYLLISHADRATYYDKGKDAELIERYGAPSGAYLDFVRAIADAVESEYPDVTVLAQAYLWSRQPPRQIQLPDNMGIMFSGIERDHSKALTAQANADVLQDLKGWGPLTDHVIVWTYHTNFANYLQPYPNLHTFGPDARTLARLDHVKGWFAQGAYNTPGGALSVMRSWILSRLMWAPRRDVATLAASFAKGYYGEAAPMMLKYLGLLEEAADDTQVPLRTKVPGDADYLTEEMLFKADQLFEAAEEAVADDPQRLQHVRTARMSVDYAVLAALPGVDGPAWVDHETRLARLEQYMADAGMSAYREGGGNEPSQLIEMLAIPRSEAPKPAVCDGVPAEDCLSEQEVAFDLAGGAQRVEDEPASDRVAARQSGDRRAWGIQLPLERLLPSEGQWQIYVQLRVTQPDPSETLVNLGVYPGRQRGVDASDLDAQGYTFVKLPGTWNSSKDRIIWVAPAGGARIEAVYVDRVVAVPEGG